MAILPGSGQICWLGLIVLTGVVFLVGCGGGSDAPPADSGSAPADAAAAPAEEASADPTPETEAAESPSEEPGEAPAEESASMEEPASGVESAPPEGLSEESTPPADAEKAPEEKPGPAMVSEAVDSRPEDVATWQDDDYRSAKEDRDPRLLDALAYLGENSAGDADAARLLVALLTTPEDPEPEPKPEPKVEKKPEKKKSSSEYDEYMGEEGGMEAPGGPDESYESGMEDTMSEEMSEEMSEYGEGYPGEEYPGSGSRKKATKTPLAASYVSLVGGIVRALGANGSKEGRAALEQILAGKVSAGKDRAAVGAVLRTLIDYPCAENDELLRKALTAPEGFRPSSEKLTAMLKKSFGQAEAEPNETAPKEGEEGQTPEKGQDIDALVAAALANTVTAEDIRDTTLPLIEKSASMHLRYDLAAYLIGKPSEELGPRLQELVTVTNPLNIQAQIGLYRYPNTPEEMRDSFERYFTSYASSTLGRMLAVSTDEGADLEEPLPTTAGETGQGGSGWSGFGAKPAQEGPAHGGRSPSGPGSPEDMDGGGMAAEDPMPSEEEMSHPPEGEGDRTGEMSEYGPSGPGEQGGSHKPPQGPGEADKMSIRMFEEVAADDPNLPYELAQQLWGKELSGALTAKMDTLTGLEEGAQMLMLAGHIPTDTMRAQLLKTLNAHWMDGPEAFASASVASETGISDPGFITIIKSLPRREPPARAKAEPTDEQSAQYAWMETVYGTVRVFCERFQTAADHAMVNQAEVLETLPFRVHSTDTLTHVYAFDWQKQVGNRLTGVPVDPMRIYYLRFEETGLYSKVLGTYKRAVPKGSERLVKDGLWVDGGKTGPDGRRISMDVIIDRTDYNPERKATMEEPMVIQVLYVEVNDPSPSKTADQR